MKTNRFQRQIFLFLSVIISSPVYLLSARTGDIRFHHLSIEDGLSQNSGYCIAQDEQGFIWIGTEAGLNKYDGYKIKVYESEADNPNSLSQSFVHSIFIDQSGIFWIGTESGLNRFDPKKEQFTRYLYDPDNSKCLSNNRVLSICEDNNGVLWIGTDRGLNRLDREKEQFTKYFNFPDDPNSLSNNGINVLYRDRSGILWIGTDGGLNKYEKGRFVRYQNSPDNPQSLSHNSVKSICEDKSGILWVGTDGGGLNKFDREKEQFIHFKNNPDDPYSLSDNRINAIYEDNSGVLWIGTNDKGLNIFNREKQKFFRYQYNIDNPTGINTNRIISIFEDNTGGIWIGTHGGGINVYHRETQKFRHYTPLGANDIRPIYVDNSGFLWVGTDGGGLNKFDREKEKITLYQHDPKDPNSISDNRIFAICEDHTGVLWIGTHGGGLNKFDKKSERFTHYKFDPDNPHSLGDNRIRTLLEDKSGVIWIGTNGGGLNKFDLNNERFTHYKFDPNDPHSLSGNRIYCMYEDRSGNLWIGAFGAGLNRFDREKEQFVHYKSDPNNVNSLNDDFVLAIYQDKNGIYWIGTIKGLNKFNLKEMTFIHYTRNDGLPDNVIYDILEDNNGYLWLSTNRGLSKFNPKTGTFKNYDVKDGLQSNEFNTGTAFKNKNGEMFFGGIGGFNAFFPDSIRDNPYVPSVVITDFQIFNKSVPVGTIADGRSILEKTITETEKIVLSYKDNVFSFEFAALHFVSPANNLYAYMMEGLEKDWNYVGNRRYVTYSGLSPGRYVFRVKGSNNDGIWNENGISLAIIIVPPYWRTWWFYTACALLVIVSTVLGYRYRVNLVKRRQKEKERLKVITDINSVLEHGNATVYRRRFDSNTYEYIGDGIKDITGYGPEKFTLSLWGKIVLTTEFAGTLAGMSIQEVFKGIHDGTIENYIMDFQFQTKSGEERWARDISTALRDESGKCSVCLGIILDITDRKQIEEELRVRNEEMTTDLNMAHEIQSAYLGRYIPYFPIDVKEDESILQFYHLYHPASSLAGDFFEIFAISDCEVGILICDVMGHGTRASLLTFYLRGLIEQLMPIASNTAVFLDNLNNGLHSIMSGSFTRIFATAFYCVANIKTGQLRYSNAGHPTPLLLRRNQGNVEVLQCKGNTFEPALGLCENYKYIANERTLSKNDIVFFFTDGLYEVMDSDGKIFSRKRLHKSMQSKLTIPPEQLLDDVLSETQQFAGKTDFDDDICMITMYVRNEI